MPKMTKRYRADLESYDPEKVYSLPDAVEKIRSFKKTKFDQTINICMHLGVDGKQDDQRVRGAASLPHGIGKTKRVIAFCGQDQIETAKEAGAIEAGGPELVKKVEEGWLDFDVAIATPDLMRAVSKLGRVLGPKGLMPSPKSGTVTPKVAEAVREYAAGKLEFRSDAGGNVHAVIGKQSFDAQKLVENAESFIRTILRLKPAGVKGQYIKKISLAGTMTPGVQVELVYA